MSRFFSKNKRVTKERVNKCGKVGDYKCKRWAWWEELGGGSKDGMGNKTNWTIWLQRNKILFFFPSPKALHGDRDRGGSCGGGGLRAWVHGCMGFKVLLVYDSKPT
jgi:hypothetical protein